MSNAQVVWDALRKNGLSEIFTAAFMGNLYAESGLIPNNMENGYEGTYNDTSYTKAINNKTYSRDSFIYDSIGYGLAQWTYWSRKRDLYDFTVGRGISIADLSAQLSYLVTESEYANTVSALNALSSADKQNIDVCTETVCWVFENPSAAYAHLDTRKRAARDYYKNFTGRDINAQSQQSAQQQATTKRNNLVTVALSCVNKTKSQLGITVGDWCAAFVRYCLQQAGIPAPDSFPDGSGVYYADNYFLFCEDIGFGKQLEPSQLQPGDLYFYPTGNYGYGHIGIVVEKTSSGYITVEGNTTCPDGKHSDFTTVEKKNRSIGATAGGVRITAGGSAAVALNGGAVSNSTAASGINYSIEYKEVTAEVKTSHIVTADADANALRTRANNLLTTPTLVESPFIWLKIGDFTFGSYSKEGSFDKVNSSVSVTYPNYMTSIQITKVNGQVNQYVINMTYQIRNGDDPNLLDKIFSSVGYGTVYISYGDWNASKFAYKEEEAIITKLDTSVDFANSRINYTLHCTSNALVLSAGYHNFTSDGTPVKPSKAIHDLIFDNADTYHLREVFNGFQDETFFWECVAGDDVAVEIETKNGIDVLSYINYLVTCMSPTSTPKSSPIRDANYYLTICEDRDRGTYFTVKKVSSSEGIMSLNNTDVYEVDVGYPGDTMVTSFKINNNNSWSLLYNYSENINAKDYTYNVDADGNIYNTYSPGVTTSSKYLRTTETQRNWWTQMTQFPVTAVLTIKGLLRPAMLMSYVRVNALFYGLRHVSSGLYIITKQVDTIDASGYRTTLSLTRVAGDLDVIVTEKKMVTKQIPVRATSSSGSLSRSTANSAYSGSAPESVSAGNSGGYIPPASNSNLVSFALSCVGVSKYDLGKQGSNDTGQIIKWVGNDNWCAAFVKYCLVNTGTKIPYFPDGSGDYYADNYFLFCEETGLGLQLEPTELQPGDLWFLPTGNYGYGHIGIVVGRDSGGYTTVEGNTSPDNTVVQKKYRSFSQTSGGVRLYSKSSAIRDLAEAEGHDVASYY